MQPGGRPRLTTHQPSEAGTGVPGYGPVRSTRNVLLHAAGEQEDFRPLFLPGPPALVQWSGAVVRGLSQSNVRQNATVCIRGEPLSAGSPAGRGFQRRGPKFQPGPGAQPGHPTIFPSPAGGNAPGRQPAATRGARRAGFTTRPAPGDWNDAILRSAADRKSTRLNSSHANISYAVFCLKKKTTSWDGPRTTASLCPPQYVPERPVGPSAESGPRQGAAPGRTPCPSVFLRFFFFNDTATTEIYTLSLHDALPISCSTSSMPRTTRVKNGFSISGMI